MGTWWVTPKSWITLTMGAHRSIISWTWFTNAVGFHFLLLVRHPPQYQYCKKTRRPYMYCNSMLWIPSHAFGKGKRGGSRSMFRPSLCSVRIYVPPFSRPMFRQSSPKHMVFLQIRPLKICTFLWTTMDHHTQLSFLNTGGTTLIFEYRWDNSK